MTPLTIESGKTVTLPKNTFTRPGYIFVGWNFKSDGTSNSFKDGQEITPSKSHTFYAQWKKEENKDIREVTDEIFSETRFTNTKGINKELGEYFRKKYETLPLYT